MISPELFETIKLARKGSKKLAYNNETPTQEEWNALEQIRPIDVCGMMIDHIDSLTFQLNQFQTKEHHRAKKKLVEAAVDQAWELNWEK